MVDGGGAVRFRRLEDVGAGSGRKMRWALRRWRSEVPSAKAFETNPLHWQVVVGVITRIGARSMPEQSVDATTKGRGARGHVDVSL